MRSELNIIRRDWLEHHRPVLMMTAAIFAVLIISGKSRDFAKGAATGLMLGASYGFTQFCFIAERQRRTLDLLLSLPIRPRNLILAKYGSVYSMTLFVVNVPGVFLGNLPGLLLVNAAAIFLSTICLTPSILSEKPWAPQVPLWIGLIVVLPGYELLGRFLPGANRALLSAFAHPAILSLFAFAASPLIAFSAAVLFERMQN